MIKVEEPSAGDPVRLAPPLLSGKVSGKASGKVRGQGALATLLLSGSQSVALDLKKEGGRRVLERLLEEADVLIESFRPGTLARLGFAPESLRQRHPRLIVCSVSGWGQDGPYAARAGHDLTYQALSGVLAATAPAMPSFPAADTTGAWAAVSAVLAALYRRERTGRGAWIDAALFDAAVHNGLVAWAEEAGGSRSAAGAAGSLGTPHGLAGALPCYNLYRTADGGILAVAPLEQHFWRRFCRAAGREDLLRLQYEETPAARDRVAALVAGKTLDAWREILAAVDLPIEPVLTPAEAAHHPQAIHRQVLVRGGDGLYRLAFPARIDGERPRAGERYPTLGEDTDRWARELGVEELPAGRRRRRRAGVGPRASLRRWMLRWLVSRR